MCRYSLIISAVLLLFSCSVMANWPQYLGPDRNGISPETGLLRSWPESGPKVLWTISVGAGYASPAIVGGKAYFLDRIEDEKDSLRCLNLLTGKELWSYEYDAPGRLDHKGSRNVPTIEGEYIYTCGPFGDLYCFDMNTRKAVWNKNIWKDFGGGRVPMWGICQHPLIYGDTVVVACQTDKAGVVAYEKATGELRWSSAKLPGLTGYVTPKLVKTGGAEQLVMISACSKSAAPDGDGRDPVAGAVVGMDPRTGKTLWEYKGYRCRIPIPNVVETGDGRLFITGGYKAGSVMLKVEKKGGGFTVSELYKTDDFGSHAHPPVLYEGHLYGHCTTNTRRDGMVCMDLDGRVKWKTERSPVVFDKGGFILADGLILSVDGREGILNLIKPDPAGFKRLSHGKLLDTRECWAPLALSDGKLIIRDQQQMKCVLVK